MHCYIKQNYTILYVVVEIIISTQLSQTYDKGLVVSDILVLKNNIFNTYTYKWYIYFYMHFQNALFHTVSYHQQT